MAQVGHAPRDVLEEEVDLLLLVQRTVLGLENHQSHSSVLRNTISVDTSMRSEG
jgi:hypothetical protein